jgi:hypothetical protein
MADWWNNLQTGMGDALIGVNNPFGLAPPEGFDRNAAMRQGALSLGMNVLANGSDNPAVALGRGYRQAQALASDNQQNALAAQAMMTAAEEKKQKRQEEAAAKAERDAFLKTLPPDVQMKARSIPGYLDSYIEATDPALQSPMDPGDRYKAVGGNIYDVETGQWITSPNGGQGDLPKGYRWKQDGTGAEAIPGVSLPGTQMRLTEQQSKDTVYYTRGEAALANLDKHEAALTGLKDTAADYLPGGNYLTSKEYQIANQAGREFLAAILRKDTGAAITSQEMAIYGKMYLPQPGDDEQVLAQKRTGRRVALDAIKSVLPAQGSTQQPVGEVDGYTIELAPEE